MSPTLSASPLQIIQHEHHRRALTLRRDPLDEGRSRVILQQAWVFAERAQTAAAIVCKRHVAQLAHKLGDAQHIGSGSTMAKRADSCARCCSGALAPLKPAARQQQLTQDAVRRPGRSQIASPENTVTDSSRFSTLRRNS